MTHQQQPKFPSETPGCSGRLCQLCRNLVPSDGESHNSLRPGDGSRCILTSCTLPRECGDVYAPSEWHMCYTHRRGCSNAVVWYTTTADVCAFLWPIATFFLSAIAISRMRHSPHICLPLRCSYVLQWVLPNGPGNPPVVRVHTTKTIRFESTTIRKPNPLDHRGLYSDPWSWTRRFRPFWLDTSVSISGSVLQVSYLCLHLDILLLIAKYWL
jgi:hypothetical protein